MSVKGPEPSQLHFANLRILNVFFWLRVLKKSGLSIGRAIKEGADIAKEFSLLVSDG